MRILHVITTLQTGGAEKLMVDLLPRLRKKGHQVELCVFEDVKTSFRSALEKEEIKMHCFKKSFGGYYSPLNIIRLTRLMRKGWDIVHTHLTSPQLFAAIGSLFCKAHIVTTEHSTSNKRRNMLWYKEVDKWMFSRYEKHIMISDQCETNLVDYLGASNCKNLVKVYNGIDYHKYASAQPADDIKALGSRIVTFVAAFRPEKDQPTLIRAMEYLPEDFHLCLVGGGNAERKAMFERMVSELKLKNRVHLLGIRNDIPEVLAASDYVVMSSHYEGLSLSSLEGMSSGRPFLASDVDGLHEIVEGAGVLFGHEDAQGFANAILKLENDDKLRKEVAKRCQEKAARFDINIMARKYLDIYEELVSFKDVD